MRTAWWWIRLLSIQILCRPTFLSAYTLGSGSRHDVISCEQTNRYFITNDGAVVLIFVTPRLYIQKVQQLWNVFCGASGRNTRICLVEPYARNTCCTSHYRTVLRLFVYLFVVCLFNKAVGGIACGFEHRRMSGWLTNNEWYAVTWFVTLNRHLPEEDDKKKARKFLTRSEGEGQDLYTDVLYQHFSSRWLH
jgi:hypothetical protein